MGPSSEMKYIIVEVIRTYNEPDGKSVGLNRVGNVKTIIDSMMMPMANTIHFDCWRCSGVDTER